MVLGLAVAADRGFGSGGDRQPEGHRRLGQDRARPARPGGLWAGRWRRRADPPRRARAAHWPPAGTPARRSAAHGARALRGGLLRRLRHHPAPGRRLGRGVPTRRRARRDRARRAARRAVPQRRAPAHRRVGARPRAARAPVGRRSTCASATLPRAGVPATPPNRRSPEPWRRSAKPSRTPAPDCGGAACLLTPSASTRRSAEQKSCSGYSRPTPAGSRGGGRPETRRPPRPPPGDGEWNNTASASRSGPVSTVPPLRSAAQAMAGSATGEGRAAPSSAFTEMPAAPAPPNTPSKKAPMARTDRFSRPRS